ncbi:MAG: hypothetical protein DMF97_10370, partial [Acidobacteria bacterium]
RPAVQPPLAGPPTLGGSCGRQVILRVRVAPEAAGMLRLWQRIARQIVGVRGAAGPGESELGRRYFARGDSCDIVGRMACRF